MICLSCSCGAVFKLPESLANEAQECVNCNCRIVPVSAEKLSDGNGEGDFDAQLIVTKGPALAGDHFFLGGCLDVGIGSGDQNHLRLEGTKTSRNHARLVRIDFGPSKWEIADCNSKNGIFVNRVKVARQELRHGDVINIGEYELRFCIKAAEPKQDHAGGRPDDGIETLSTSTRGVVCPSCARRLSAAARICTACGIHVPSGRPLFTSAGIDEESLSERAREFIEWLSVVVRVTPMPIPLESEAFGTRKPVAVWTIAIVTAICSFSFYVWNKTDYGYAAKDLMLWAPNAPAWYAQQYADPKVVRAIVQEMNSYERQVIDQEKSKLRGKVSDQELDLIAARTVITDQALQGVGEFHGWQLVTHALLHDPDNIFVFAMHLGGNLLFLLVFGTRVNSLIGNVATTALYVLLATASGAVHLYMDPASVPFPLLGASGAIMGLAGIYIVLFPVHRVFCAMWVRSGFGVESNLGLSVFPMHGLTVLVLYFVYDFLMALFTSHLTGGVAHWAHLGGFVAGVTFALVLLISRIINTGGGDILSVCLGRHAWWLIGKPSRWRGRALPGFPAGA